MRAEVNSFNTQLMEENYPSTSNQRTQRLASLPILILNVHNRCNCRCVMCDIWKREANVEIKAEALERHRESIQQLGVEHVVLSGGEPLLHSDLHSLCGFFRKLGVRLTLLTTGLLLKKRAEAVASLFDEVIVSLDGPPTIHDEIRRVKGAFQLIQDGVAAVRILAHDMPIHGRSTVQKINHHLLRKTVEAAKQLQLTSISFLAADLTSEAFNRPLIWPGERQNEIALTDQEVSVLEQEIESLIKEHEDDIAFRYIAEAPDKLRRIPLHYRGYLKQMAPEAPICNAPWVSAVVEVDGTVRPCFFHRSIGNLNDSTLEEVINGDSAMEFRSSLQVNDNPTCQRCVCSLNYRQHNS
jgi:MoaA/NifB/PqqE/SkfB family radical SAM enzyme